MKLYYIIFLFSCIMFSQPKVEEKRKINIDSLLQTDEYVGIEIKKHIVKKGERMKNIYQKYKITPGEIYRLNPEAKDSLKIGSTLLIPIDKKVVYREWLNPNWVKQNEEKLRKEKIYRDSMSTLSRTKRARLALQEEDAKKNKKNSKKLIKSKKENVTTKENKIIKDTIKELAKVEVKKAENNIVENTKTNTSAITEKKSIDSLLNTKKEVDEELVENKGKKSKKKKKKEEIKYGSPEDHDIFLDPKNKANYVLHEIEENETLEKIAKKYNLPDFALLEFNKKVDFSKVPAGSIMKIPNLEKENVQNYIYDLKSEYRRLNIKYDSEIVKKKFTYNYEEED